MRNMLLSRYRLHVTSGRELSTSPRRVLVAEEPGDFRETVTMLLRRAGYSVAEASDGVVARDTILAASAAGATRFGALICDSAMPHASGFAMLKDMRSYLADTRVILMSTRVTSDFQRQARELGVARVLEKPLAPEELLGALDGLGLAAS